MLEGLHAILVFLYQLTSLLNKKLRYSFSYTGIVEARYMPRPSHPPLFDHPDNIWRRVQIMELLILLFFPAS
jgi:hypothetical protein